MIGVSLISWKKEGMMCEGGVKVLRLGKLVRGAIKKVKAKDFKMPEGWTTITTMRNGGKTKGTYDKYFTSPDGKKRCRSYAEIQKYMVAPFCDAKCLHPVGYTSQVVDKSSVIVGAEATYTQTILDGGYAPKFQIVGSDDPKNPVVELTANSAWRVMMRRIAFCQADEEEKKLIEEEDAKLEAEKKMLAGPAASAAGPSSAAGVVAGMGGVEEEEMSGSKVNDKNKKAGRAEAGGSTKKMKKMINSPFRKTNSRYTTPNGSLRFGLSIPKVMLMLEGLDGMSQVGKQYKHGFLRRSKAGAASGIGRKRRKEEASAASKLAAAARAVRDSNVVSRDATNPPLKKSKSSPNEDKTPPGSRGNNAMASPPAEQPEDMNDVDSPAGFKSDEPSPTSMDMVIELDSAEVLSSQKKRKAERKSDGVSPAKRSKKIAKKGGEKKVKQANLMGFFGSKN